MKMLAAVVLLAAIATPAPAQQWTPDAGTRAYRLEIVEHIAGRADGGYRMDYDLIADGKGGALAVVRSADTLYSGTPTPVAIDESCRAALKSAPGEIARVTLAPETAVGLGEGWMPGCAPTALFIPLSEILRVTMVQLAPQFGLAQLHTPGDSQRFAAFGSHIDRPRMKLDIETAGGTIAFIRAEGSRATIDWTPDMMAVQLVNRDSIPGIAVRGEGNARMPLRLEINRATGALVAADSIGDRVDLILDIKDAPPIPFTLTRDLSIRPRTP